MTRRNSFFLLIALVLLAHALLLARVSARQTPQDDAPKATAFQTRMVAAPPAAVAAIAIAASKPAAAAPPPRSRAPRTPSPARAVAQPRAAQPAPAEPQPAAPHTLLQEDLAAILAQRGFVTDAPTAAPTADAPAQATTVANAEGADGAEGAAAGSGGAPSNGAAEESGNAGSGAANEKTSTPHAPAIANTPQAESAAAATAKAPTAAQSQAPVLPPASRRLGFDVSGRAKGFNYSARAELLWQHDGNTYHAHQEIKVMFLGSRSQDSEGRITPRGLEPSRFVDKAKGERSASFDYDQGHASFSSGAPAAPIQRGAQDRLSVFLQLASLMAGAPSHYPKGSEIAMTTVSARGADPWTFTVQGEETLELPLGATPAVQLQRMRRKANDQRAQVWLAPGLGYLPVRIRITEPNGDFAQLDLRTQEAP